MWEKILLFTETADSKPPLKWKKLNVSFKIRTRRPFSKVTFNSGPHFSGDDNPHSPPYTVPPSHLHYILFITTFVYDLIWNSSLKKKEKRKKESDKKASSTINVIADGPRIFYSFSNWVFFSNKIDLSYGAECYGDVFNKFSQTNPI